MPNWLQGLSCSEEIVDVEPTICYNYCSLQQLFSDSLKKLLLKIINLGWDQLPASNCGAWRGSLKSPEVFWRKVERGFIKNYLVNFKLSGQSAVSPTQRLSWRLGLGMDLQ